MRGGRRGESGSWAVDEPTADPTAVTISRPQPCSSTGTGSSSHERRGIFGGAGACHAKRVLSQRVPRKTRWGLLLITVTTP